MKGLVQMTLGGGDTILVEVQQEGEQGMRAAGAGADYLVGQAQHSFEAVLKTINSAAGAVAGTLRNLAPCPEEISVEFGVSLKLDGKAFVVSVGSEATFKIALKWKAAGDK
jgi:hypothetical protein